MVSVLIKDLFSILLKKLLTIMYIIAFFIIVISIPLVKSFFSDNTLSETEEKLELCKRKATKVEELGYFSLCRKEFYEAGFVGATSYFRYIIYDTTKQIELPSTSRAKKYNNILEKNLIPIVNVHFYIDKKINDYYYVTVTYD